MTAAAPPARAPYQVLPHAETYYAGEGMGRRAHVLEAWRLVGPDGMELIRFGAQGGEELRAQAEKLNEAYGRASEAPT